MAFNLFKKPLPSDEDKKNPKFKDTPKVEDELTLDELERVGGNYNEIEFKRLREVGKQLQEEKEDMFKGK